MYMYMYTYCFLHTTAATVRPPLEEIRAKYYREMKKFVFRITSVVWVTLPNQWPPYSHE